MSAGLYYEACMMLDNWREWAENRPKYTQEDFERLVHSSDELYDKLLDASVAELRRASSTSVTDTGVQP